MIVARNVFLIVLLVFLIIWLVAYLTGGVGVFLLLYMYLLYELNNAKNSKKYEK